MAAARQHPPIPGAAIHGFGRGGEKRCRDRGGVRALLAPLPAALPLEPERSYELWLHREVWNTCTGRITYRPEALDSTGWTYANVPKVLQRPRLTVPMPTSHTATSSANLPFCKGHCPTLLAIQHNLSGYSKVSIVLDRMMFPDT